MTTADPRKDQIAQQLRDLKRLGELIQIHGRGGELHISALPTDVRAEVEAINDRVGDLHDTKQKERQELLLYAADAEAFLDSLPTARQTRKLLAGHAHRP
jgi:hypothetical protein